MIRSENCFYCENGYMAGDELLCIGFMEGEEDCDSYVLADYFIEGEWE